MRHSFDGVNDRRFLLLGAGAFLLLFLCGAIRHELFRSTAFDLGIFDQALYLMSRGITPFTSLTGYHIMGDHAAFLLYGLALPYTIRPTVYWLFAIQSAALVSAIWPLRSLGESAGLTPERSLLVCATYLLYPLVFNINLFDFHPEVLVPTSVLVAILAARARRPIVFLFTLVVILGTKAIMGVAVACVGIWLLLVGKGRRYGAVALVVGLSWTLFAISLLIPHWKGGEHAAFARYAYLGSSVSQSLHTLVSHPELVLAHIASVSSARYLVLVIGPVLWGLSARRLSPLLAAIPLFLLNMLPDYPMQRDLVHQYSLPILPFLWLSVVFGTATGKTLLSRPRDILVFALAAFLLFGRYGVYVKYLATLDTWNSTRHALATVPGEAPVLTDNFLAPHLSHRRFIQLISSDSSPADLPPGTHLVFNTRHPWPDTREAALRLLHKIDSDADWELLYDQKGMFVYRKRIMAPIDLYSGNRNTSMPLH